MSRLLAATAVVALCVGLAMWTIECSESESGVPIVNGTTDIGSGIVDTEAPAKVSLLRSTEPNSGDRAEESAFAQPALEHSRALLPIALSAGAVVLGSVRDSAGRPIPDASVVLSGPRWSDVADWQDSRSEWSDDLGSFAIAEVQDGTYDIQCRADGYFGHAQGVFEVAAGVAPLVHLILELGLGYSGRVVSSDGEGIGGATIRLVVSMDVGGTLSEATVWTHRDGQFEIQGVPDGAAVLFACDESGRGFLPRETRAPSIAELPWEIMLAHGATIEIVLQASVGVALPQSVVVTLAREGVVPAGPEPFSSSVTHEVVEDRVHVTGLEAGTYTARLFVEGFEPAVADGVAVEENRTTIVPMNLGDAGRQATIVVMDPSRKAIAGARIISTLRDREPGSHGPPVTLGICDERGEWQIRIAEGFVVDLTIEASEFAPARACDIDVMQQGARWEFTLEPAAILQVTVRDGTGYGDPMVDATLEPVQKATWMSAAPLLLPSRHSSEAASEFRFEGLASGTYQLRLQRADIEIYNSEIVFAVGESKTVEVTVDPGLVVHGSISINGIPVDGGTVYLISANRGSSGKVDQWGGYMVTVAEGGVFTVQYRRPDGCTLQQGPLEIVGPLELPLDFRAVSFEGEVLLPDGNPAGGVRWTLEADGGSSSYHGRTNAEGRIALDAVMPADYSWRVDAPAGCVAPELYVALHSDTTANLTIARKASLRILLSGAVDASRARIAVLRERSGPQPAEIFARPQVEGDPLIVSWAEGARFGYASCETSARIFDVPPGADVVAVSLEPCGTLLARFLPRVASPDERRSVTIDWLESGVAFRITTVWGGEEREVSLALPPGEYQARSFTTSGEHRNTRFHLIAGERTEVDLE